MIRTFSDAQLDKLKNGLRATAALKLPLHLKVKEELRQIRFCVDALDEYINVHPFENDEEEINYHKHIYPQFRSLYIYQAEVHKLISDLPELDKKALKKHYRSQLDRIRENIRREEFHYRYFKLNADDLDDLYFRTDPGRHSVLLPILSEPGGCRSTDMGCLFALFKAYELLYRYILIKMDELSPKLPGTKISRPFKWTGEVIHLIEIAYGIYLTKQVNKGKVGIVEFFDGLGEFFGVNLGIPKKGFDDMKKRKRLSKTHFIDTVRDKIHQEMDEADQWKPRS